MTFIVNGLAFLSGAVIFVGLLIWISVMIDKVLEARKQPVTDDADSRWRHYLKASAHWFSEDNPTMRLLAGLAERKNVDTLREEWRTGRKAAPTIVEAGHVNAPGAGQSQVHAAAPPDSCGAWRYDEPHFVDSEDCMGQKETYWRTWGCNGTAIHAGFGFTAAQAMEDCVRKCEGQQAAPPAPKTYAESRSKSQVLALRKTLVGCCSRFGDNQACDCLEVARADAAALGIK